MENRYLGHEGSVNAVAWAPREYGLRLTTSRSALPLTAPCPLPLRVRRRYGLRLATAASDENVSVLSHLGDGRWAATMFKAHKTGCNAVAWAPYLADGLEPSHAVSRPFSRPLTPSPHHLLA